MRAGEVWEAGDEERPWKRGVGAGEIKRVNLVLVRGEVRYWLRRRGRKFEAGSAAIASGGRRSAKRKGW